MSEQRRFLYLWTLTLLLILASVSAVAAGAPLVAPSGSLRVPHITHAPKLEDFEDMAPHGPATELRQFSDFIQQQPSDGKPATQRTEAYIGYDDINLYIAFLCWDKNAAAIRGHLTRREAVTPPDDDYVEVTLDTFHDQRHAFIFDVNPMAVQADALYTEGSGTNYSFDTLWFSRARITDKGYVIWMAIPFRSLRFHPDGGQSWGVTLMRYVAREGEYDYWPRVSSTVSGRLLQEATLTGFEGVSPGRNIQLIPYASGRSFRALDTRDATDPRFSSRTAEGKAGLDAKVVLRDSLVLDATINPDFAQVESDEPQNTINQRFEVFFPEKRPFFMENSNFFEGPLIAVPFQSRFLFTRRIADPSFGLRLSGKEGPWNLGFLVADDRSPGKIVPDSDPLSGKRAYFAVARVSRDIGGQSSIGALYTDREFMNDFNRVGGMDGMLRISKNWTSSYRGMVSSTRTDTEGYLFGQHHEAVLHGNGRRFTFDLMYLDITPNFRTETGYVPRVDQRAIYQYGHFYFRPEGKHLVFHGLEQNTVDMWDHSGTTLQQVRSVDYAFSFRRNIVIAPVVFYQTDTLRPIDFSGLPSNRQYAEDGVGLIFRGSPSRLFSWNTQFYRDGTVVVVPAAGQLPYTGAESMANVGITIRPTGRLQIDNTYILDRVLNGHAHRSVFNNHIIRTKWNYQFSREFSLRFISQYNGLLSNPQFSQLQTTKGVNFDVLFTYLLHPGTAVYVGYNTDLANIDPGLCLHIAGSTECDPNGNGLIRSPNRLINDGRQFFIKVSYLFRR